jgi:hypothetical protein
MGKEVNMVWDLCVQIWQLFTYNRASYRYEEIAENSYEVLVEKVRERAKRCRDIDVIIQQMEWAPRGSIVETIWRQRLDERTLEELRGRIESMSFEEMLVECQSAHHTLDTTFEFLRKRCMETAQSYACKSSFEAYQIYSSFIWLDADSVKAVFKRLSLELAKSEVEGHTDFLEAVKAYRREKNKYSREERGRGEKIPTDIGTLWKRRLSDLHYEHALSHASLCLSSIHAKKGMMRLRLYDGKGCEVWGKRYVELLNEEAEKNAHLCDSVECARKKYIEAKEAKAEIANDLWNRSYGELAKKHAKSISDVKAIKKFFEQSPQKSVAKAEYLLRYLELC